MDTLIRFLFDRYRVRGQIVRLDDAWAEVARRHRRQDGRDLAPTVRERLGELSTAGLLLAASLKFNGALVLQIRGAGPVSLYVVECESDGTYRATVKLRPDALVPPDASLGDLVNQDGGGRFVVTLVPDRSGRDTGAKAGESGDTGRIASPYQGIVPFEGDTVAEVLENYMARSEQIKTRLWLAADDRHAFGLLLQRMPDEGGHEQPADGTAADAAGGQTSAGASGDVDPDGWHRVVTLADTLTRDEMLELPAEAILQRLFWDTPLAALDSRRPTFACSCSRGKVAAMLRMLGQDEVESILAERGEVAVTCEFCSNAYRFDAADSAELFLASPPVPEGGAKR